MNKILKIYLIPKNINYGNNFFLIYEEYNSFFKKNKNRLDQNTKNIINDILSGLWFIISERIRIRIKTKTQKNIYTEFENTKKKEKIQKQLKNFYIDKKN